MKILALTVFLLAAPNAFAADRIPDPNPKTACGTTVEECQRAVDARDKQIAQFRTALLVSRQQRINAQNSQADAEINASIAQQDQADAIARAQAKQGAPAK